MHQHFYTAISFAAFILVGVLIGLYQERKHPRSGGGSGNFFLPVCAAFILMFIVGIVGQKRLPTEWSEKYESIRLVDMRDGTIMEGRIPPGSTKESRLVIFFEENRQDGELRIYHLEYAKDWYAFFGLPLEIKKYEFHIPKGGITKGSELK